MFSQLFSLVLRLLFATVQTILKMNMTHMFLLKPWKMSAKMSSFPWAARPQLYTDLK